MKVIKDVSYGAASEQVLDVYIPDKDDFEVYVYFHGGGLENGGKELAFVPKLAENVAVVSADYRKYPTAKYPDFIEDAAAVVAWAKENMPRYGNVTGLYVGGSSAGAYLSQMLCFDEKWLAKHNISNIDISGYYHAAGQPTTHFNVLKERGIDTRRVIVDEAAPMFYIDDTKTYPPMEIVVSDNDRENRYEQTMLLVSTLKHFGHDMTKIYLNVMENSNHCDYKGAVDENGRHIYADMIYDFIKRTRN
ncbi:MAG: alpha/beta hydrolase [Clostridia bacterium]|nr:alpha/beta hydrolase [Clostridia bacterium]